MVGKGDPWRQNITECPSGTYKPNQDPGDMRSCLPCPGSDMTSPPASHHVDQCRCREGFTYKRGQCVVMDCPANLPPENGYFIRNECKNVFNAACGVRCNSGYQVTSNLLTCLRYVDMELTRNVSDMLTWSHNIADVRIQCQAVSPIGSLEWRVSDLSC